MTESSEHPDWNDLAALADRGSEGAPPELLDHLAVCPQCMAAWSAAVEHRDRSLAESTTAPGSTVRGSRLSGQRRPRIPREWFWGSGGLAAAALLLALLFPRDGSRDVANPSEQLVLDRLARLSRTGLVYPRVPALGATTNEDYRAGGDVGGAVDVSPWLERFGADPADTSAAFWLSAGYLANGQLDLADDVLRRAQARTPRARELRELAAITAYRRNEIETARELLGAILRDSPEDHLAAFNLAVIQLETGRQTEARTVLERLADDHGEPDLQRRATQLLRRLNSH